MTTETEIGMNSGDPSSGIEEERRYREPERERLQGARRELNFALNLSMGVAIASLMISFAILLIITLDVTGN